MRVSHSFTVLVLGAPRSIWELLWSVSEVPVMTVPLSDRPGDGVGASAFDPMVWVARRSCPGEQNGAVGLVVLGVSGDRVSSDVLAALVDEVDVVCAFVDDDPVLDRILAGTRVPVVLAVPASAADRPRPVVAEVVARSVPSRVVAHRSGDVSSDREIVAAALELLLQDATPAGPSRETV